jgi:hypothetical protein
VKISFSDRVEVPKDVLVRFVEKETVLLNLETECYYGLDETGTRMWQLVTAAPSIGHLTHRPQKPRSRRKSLCHVKSWDYLKKAHNPQTHL